MTPNFSVKFKLFIVNQCVHFENLILKILRVFLFADLKNSPRNILIYKIGNIGDIACAIPAFIAIRRHYPRAQVTLLTSPGRRDSLGAQELISGAWYIDELKIYHAEDIQSLGDKMAFMKTLRGEKYDLFIELPDDLAKLRTMLRNMIFAKIIGAKGAFGFKIRTIQLFKKTQVDYLSQETEAQSLLRLLADCGVKSSKPEFNLPISEKEKIAVRRFLEKQWPNLSEKDVIIGISPGGKREGNQWPAQRFKEIAEYLEMKYQAKIIIFGGKDEVPKSEAIRTNLNKKNFLTAAGKLNFLETAELLKHCRFLISNSTGTIHLAAAAGIPAIGLYSIRDVFGRWFPYGDNHKILYHKFLTCDYRSEECIKKSIEAILVEEVKEACDEFLAILK